MRQRASIIREIARIENLNSCVLLTVERSHDRLRLTGFATQIERHFWIIEPEAQVILVRRWERDIAIIAERDRECLYIEDPLHSNAARAILIGLQIALIPGNAEGFVGKFDDEEVVASVRGQAGGIDRHLIVQRVWLDGDCGACMRQA